MAQYRSPRKKWATRLNPADQRKTHPSEAAVWRYVNAVADQYRSGLLRRDLSRLTVWVDEGLGRGWELYETVNLADWAASRATGEGK